MAAKNKRTFELTLGKLGVILFISGMSVLLFSVFLLGIVVGKNMEAYPEKYSAGLKELIYDHLFASAPQEGKRPPSSESGVKGDSSGGGGESPALTFYDTLSGKKGAAQSGKTAVRLKDAPAEISTPPSVMAAKPEIPPVSAPEAGAIDKRDSQAAGSAGAPRDGGASAETGGFEVQVAAYQERRKAEQMVDKLSPLGYSAEVLKKEIAGKGTWFRVIVGGFGSREKAKAASDRISGNIGGVKCAIRPSGNSGGN